MIWSSVPKPKRVREIWFCLCTLLTSCEPVNDGREILLPLYKNTAHAIHTIGQAEVSHGALRFMFYEEAGKFLINVKSDKQNHPSKRENLLTAANYATLGSFSKLAAMMLTYPYQVLRSRLMQRPGFNGSFKYSNSIHVIKETMRFEGIRGFYRGITPSLVKILPAASITFVVYEKALALLR